MRLACVCPCHDAATDDGVDVRDPLEAAIACPVCVNNHCMALLDDEPPSRPLPQPDTSTAWTDEGPE
jgi:hypothetical protein